MLIKDLKGRWELGVKGGAKKIPVNIPGDNYSALINANRMPDPYYGLNELDVQWAAKEDWIFSRSFSIDHALSKKSRIFLNCACLDTVTEIFINDQFVGKTNNMFIRYRFEVKQFLRQGRNKIAIHFFSAEKIAHKLNAQAPYAYPHTVNPVQSRHRNLVRKVQCHSGWDWGPCLMVCGIYDQIYLGADDEGRVEYIHTDQEHFRDYCLLTVNIELFSYAEKKKAIEIELGSKRQKKTYQLKKGFNTIKEKIRIDKPELWWPAGYGKPHLYTLAVKVFNEVVEKKIGLRQVRLNTEKDTPGKKFIIMVNGKDIFCKGANWIPVDALPQRQTRGKYELLLASLLQANMNMIRVWGGGQYEKDFFYEYCDRRGIMVWQDFMFACALYPASKEFLDLVKEEATHQIKRLKNHSSIVLWCGNNESLGVLKWFPEPMIRPWRYRRDYLDLNEGVIGKAAGRLDPGRPWWPSSPSAGVSDFTDCFHNPHKGDMHYWRVWHEGKPFEFYYKVVPRFCSEFGFQSFPSLGTIKDYCPPGQLHLSSPAMRHHQKSRRGNTIIKKTMRRYFSPAKGFPDFLFLSQVQQAYALKTAIEYWRSRRPHCMGILYWQLNDNWPVASWSSIEYGGKWKVLHYLLARSFAPVHVCAYSLDDKVIKVYGINDTGLHADGMLIMEIIDFNGRLVEEIPQKVRINAASACELFLLDMKSIKFEPKNSFSHIRFLWAKQEITNDLFFVKPIQCHFKSPHIRAEVTEQGRAFAISLKTSAPAFFVCIDHAAMPGKYSANAFTLLPGRERTVVFVPEGKCGLKGVKEKMKIYNLNDSTR